eukprot:2211973-Prymnesium_polylepis.1
MVPGGGTAEQPHVWVLTMDGAGLTSAESGVRLAMYPGSVQKMNQSVQIMNNLVSFRESHAAEAYMRP